MLQHRRMVSAIGQVLFLLAVLGGVSAFRVKRTGSPKESSENKSVNREEVDVKQRLPVRGLHRIVRNHEASRAAFSELKAKSLNRRNKENEEGKQQMYAQGSKAPQADSILQDASSPPSAGVPQVTKQRSNTQFAGFFPNKWQTMFMIAAATIIFLMVFVVVFCHSVYTTGKGRSAKQPRQRLTTAGTSGDNSTPVFGTPPNVTPVFAERKAHVHNGHTVFHWEQAEKVIKLYIDVPEGIQKSDLEIKIGTHHLQVGVAGKVPFMMDELFAAINENESVWRLRSNGELQIKLQKAVCLEWPRVLK